MEETVRKYALQNAVFFKGKANPKSVVGKVLGEVPEFRSRSSEVMEVVDVIVSEVNAMPLESQKQALAAIDSNLLIKEKKERTDRGVLFTSGLIAGEGIVGILLAVLTVFEVNIALDFSLPQILSLVIFIGLLLILFRQCMKKDK